MASVMRMFVNSFSNRLEAPVRQHLKNVYGCLSLSAISAAAGFYVHLYTDLLHANILTTIGALALIFFLSTTPDNGKNQTLRLSYLLGFAFLSGIGLGPVLEVVISIDPSIVVTALTGTMVVFISFSISALLAERGQWLYLGGLLFSTLNALVLFSLANLFFRSALIYQAHLYIGLFLMCGFVIYDTQLIIEKHHMGSKDFIGHSLDLFIDLISIFRYLLTILMRKELSREQQRKRKE